MPVQDVGYVNAVWADTGSDSNYILAGSIYGGLFKSTDGGKHWANITDNAPIVGGVTGVNQITVDPNNINNIYLGTLGAGILESFDGGNTWQQEFIGYGGYRDTIENVQAVFLTPDASRIYAFKDDSVYTRYNIGTGNTWHNITPPGNDSLYTWLSLQFVPGSPDHFFISNQMGVGSNPDYEGIYKSTVSVPTSSDWEKITEGFTDSVAGIYIDTNGWNMMTISVPDLDTLFFFARANTGHAGIYKYSISGASIKRVNNYLPSTDGGTARTDNKGVIVVSAAATDSNAGRRNIYYGTDVPYHSYDGGISFHAIGQYMYGFYSGLTTHGDARCLYLQQATDSKRGIRDRLLVATDGGVSLKYTGTDDSVAGDGATINISGKGLTCGTFNGFYTSEAGGLGIGGMMHDGVVGYEPKNPTPWDNLYVADAWTTTFNNADPTKALAFQGGKSPVILQSTKADHGRELDSIAGFAQPIALGGFGPPIGTDNYNDVYCGTDRLSVKTPALSVFAEPTALGFPHANPNDFIGAVEFSPYDTTFTGYVMYYYASQLYYRNQTISLGHAQLTTTVPGADGNHYMNCLVTDPRNTFRVWVALGDRSYNTMYPLPHDLLYSEDHGTTWAEVSSGLPTYLPITKMVYDETTNTVYASTDIGIFKCDFSGYNSAATVGGINNSVTWSCFNQGMVSGHDFPNVNVCKLVINHCQGKLYAATNGRSVWSTDIAPIANPNPTDTITGHTTWSTPNIYITGGIEVLPGGTLTISGDTIHMPKNGVISVEPGGRLIVNNAVITNDCDQCFWQGIQARGNTSLPQLLANQGWVTINNSVIEHAVIGVANDNTAVGFGTTGGVIQATNSSFIDNHNGATFDVYDNWHGSTLFSNLSYFTNCTFLLDNNYKGDKMNYPMTNFVSLHDVEGISFSGCSFLNRDTMHLDKGKGEGIHSVNSGFNVGPWCPLSGMCSTCPCTTTLHRSHFGGLINGIALSSVMGYDPTVSIDQTDFDSIGVGVNVSVQNNVSTTRCNFNVGNGVGVVDVSAGCYQNIGIYTHNVSQFRIEANDFEGAPSGMAATVSNWHNLGAVVANVGLTTNTVYSNSFDSLTEGVYAIGDNYGVRVSCNAFSNNTNDILVGNDGTSTFQGIYPSMGAELPARSAGNTFSGSIKNVVNNTAEHIDYCYDTLYSSIERPNIVTGFVAQTPVNARKSCYSTISDGAGPFSPVRLNSSTLHTYKEEFRIAKRAWQDSLNVYYELLDNGSTPSMVHGIQTSVRPLQLDSLVRPPSPWLSDSSLYHVTRRGLLPYARYISVLRRNPVVLSEPGFLPYAHTAYSITPTDMAMLSDSAKVINRRVKLESSIAHNKMKMDEAANIITMAMKVPNDTAISVTDTTGAGICTDSANIYYGLDSNSVYTQLDSVGKWYKDIGSLWSWYARVGYDNFLGERVRANRVFNRIGELLSIDSLGELRPNFAFQSNPQDNNVYRTYTRLWDVIKHAESRGSDIFHLDSLEIARLDTSSGPAFTYNTARQIITSITTGIINVRVLVLPCHYTRFTLRDAGGGTGGESDNSGELSSGVSYPSDIGNIFSAYPNPASGMVTFEYNVPDAGNDVRIVITDVVGQQVAELHTRNNAGKILWDTHLLANGIYLFQASTDNGLVSVGKIVLAK